VGPRDRLEVSTRAKSPAPGSIQPVTYITVQVTVGACSRANTRTAWSCSVFVFVSMQCDRGDWRLEVREA